jgi:hypothetical protein
VHMSLGPSCPICPFSMESGGTKINTQVWRALAPEDVARQEAHRVCSEWLRHGGEGDGWWETRSSRARGSSTRRSHPPGTSASADQNIKHLFQVSLKGQGKESLPAHPWLPLSFLISSYLCFYNICLGGGERIHLCHRWSRFGHERWRMSRCRHLFGKMLRVSSVRSSSSRVNLWRHARLGRWPRRNFAACLTRQLVVRDSY